MAKPLQMYSNARLLLTAYRNSPMSCPMVPSPMYLLAPVCSDPDRQRTDRQQSVATAWSYVLCTVI